MTPSFGHIRNLLWDWNGTLIDDVALCVAVLGELCRRHGIEPVTVEEYRDHFGFPVVQFYNHLGFDTTPESFRALSEVFIATYYERFAQGSTPHREATALALEWSRRGGPQAILSASRQDHLELALRHHGLEALFPAAAGIADIYAGGKIGRGRELLEALRWDPAETLLIGDTDHDAEVARALGVDCLLVARGHQSLERLQRGGGAVVTSLEEARRRFQLGRAVQIELAPLPGEKRHPVAG